MSTATHTLSDLSSWPDTGTSTHLAVIGHPIDHSLSPALPKPPAGAIGTTNATYADDNRITALNGLSLSSDNNGNLKTIPFISAQAASPSASMNPPPLQSLRRTSTLQSSSPSRLATSDSSSSSQSYTTRNGTTRIRQPKSIQPQSPASTSSQTSSSEALGLLGQYYDYPFDPYAHPYYTEIPYPFPSTEPLYENVESVDFDWWDESPAPDVPNDNFAVRWTGNIIPSTTGNYTLRTSGEDGVRLWIDGELLIDDWCIHPPVTNDSPVLQFTAGQPVPITLEYFEGFGEAMISLQWKIDNASFSPIPAANLRPPQTPPEPEIISLVDASYDARNRLTQLNLPSGNVTYTYDPENHRIASTDSSGTTRYLIDPHSSSLPQVIEIQHPNNTRTTFIYAGNTLLYHIDPSGNPTYYHYDPFAKTAALTNDDGTITDRFAYSPYGQILHREGSTQTPFQFCGQLGVQTDPTGLIHMRARYYSSTLKRFITADSAGFNGGMNWYAYVNGNPIRYADPRGFWPERIHNRIINTAFSGRSAINLPDNELAILKAASVRVDTFQDPRDSYMHAMRAPGQTVAQAQSAYNNYIEDRLNQAVALAVKGDRNAALAVLGEGMHPMMDSTSPSHTGFQEWPGLWEGYSIKTIKNLGNGADHWSLEQYITPALRNATAGVLRDYYNRFENTVATEKLNTQSYTRSIK